MGSVVKLVTLALVAVFAAIAANWARDIAYQVNALTVMAVASGFFIHTIRTMDRPRVAATGYMDDVIRAGVIATAFWGMVGFAAGARGEPAGELEGGLGVVFGGLAEVGRYAGVAHEALSSRRLSEPGCPQRGFLGLQDGPDASGSHKTGVRTRRL